MTDKELLDRLDEECRGIWFNPKTAYWTVQDSNYPLPTRLIPTSIRTALEAAFNAEPVTES